LRTRIRGCILARRAASCTRCGRAVALASPAARDHRDPQFPRASPVRDQRTARPTGRPQGPAGAQRRRNSPEDAPADAGV